VEELSLRVEGRDDRLAFFWRQGGGEWRQIGGEEKADVLTTGTAGGFIGATIGMYATGGCAK
jgi:beta-xylosidase